MPCDNVNSDITQSWGSSSHPKCAKGKKGGWVLLKCKKKKGPSPMALLPLLVKTAVLPSSSLLFLCPLHVSPALPKYFPPLWCMTEPLLLEQADSWEGCYKNSGMNSEYQQQLSVKSCNWLSRWRRVGWVPLYRSLKSCSSPSLPGPKIQAGSASFYRLISLCCH